MTVLYVDFKKGRDFPVKEDGFLPRDGTTPERAVQTIQRAMEIAREADPYARFFLAAHQDPARPPVDPQETTSHSPATQPPQEPQ